MKPYVKLLETGSLPINAGTNPASHGYYRDEVTGQLIHGGGMSGKTGKIVAEDPLRPGIMKLWKVQNEIPRLAALGMTELDIASELGISKNTVWNALNRNPLVQEKLAVLQGKRDLSTIKITERIKALQPLALEVLEEDLMGGVSRKLRNETARKVLEMGGNGPIKKQLSAQGVFTMADLNKINQKAALLRGEKRKIEETEYEEVV